MTKHPGSIEITIFQETGKTSSFWTARSRANVCNTYTVILSNYIRLNTPLYFMQGLCFVLVYYNHRVNHEICVSRSPLWSCCKLFDVFCRTTTPKLLSSDWQPLSDWKDRDAFGDILTLKQIAWSNSIWEVPYGESSKVRCSDKVVALSQ